MYTSEGCRSRINAALLSGCESWLDTNIKVVEKLYIGAIKNLLFALVLPISIFWLNSLSIYFGYWFFVISTTCLSVYQFTF